MPFIFKREVKTIDPIMQNNFLVLIKKKKKKDCIKRCFISLRSPSSVKRKMTEVTVKRLCAKFGLKNYALSIPVIQCAWGVQRENTEQTAGS